MGLFDKVKSNIDTAVEKTKEGVTIINEKQNAYYEGKREERKRKQEEKIEKQKREREQKIKNPKYNVNNLPGIVNAQEDKLIINARGKNYIVSYGDVKRLESYGNGFIIVLRDKEFKIIPRLGYAEGVSVLFNDIFKKWNANKNKSNQVTLSSSSVTDDLEKVMNMYEKGLLTDDEFTAMKKKIMEK